jgi:hypothetical protein
VAKKGVPPFYCHPWYFNNTKGDKPHFYQGQPKGKYSGSPQVYRQRWPVSCLRHTQVQRTTGSVIGATRVQ